MKLGKWVTNIEDPNLPTARGDMSDTEWEYHLKYVAEHVVGRPKASKEYTVWQLENWGLVGLYKKP